VLHCNTFTPLPTGMSSAKRSNIACIASYVASRVRMLASTRTPHARKHSTAGISASANLNVSVPGSNARRAAGVAVHSVCSGGASAPLTAKPLAMRAERGCVCRSVCSSNA
jgi:hypothetical protein